MSNTCSISFIISGNVTSTPSEIRFKIIFEISFKVSTLHCILDCILDPQSQHSLISSTIPKEKVLFPLEFCFFLSSVSCFFSIYRSHYSSVIRSAGWIFARTYDLAGLPLSFESITRPFKLAWLNAMSLTTESWSPEKLTWLDI